MITVEHTKEDLSRAYIQAISAKAGVILSIKDRSHDYGIDGSFHEVFISNGQRYENGTVLDFQLKATSRDVIKEDGLSFPLDARMVNFLKYRADRPNTVPAILIVLVLPPHPESWLELSEDELVIRKCCYWTSISSSTTNIYSATVKIPKEQMLTPGELQRLLERTSVGQFV